METLYQTFDAIIASNKAARKRNDYLTLVINAEALVEYMPQLILLCVDEESNYRKYMASLSDNRDNSMAWCEAQAKAQDSYRNWQRGKMTIDLLYEAINIAKKLAANVDKSEKL